MEKYIIIHYGEIYLKGGNRKFFENQLLNNIKLALQKIAEVKPRLLAGRIIIEFDEKWNWQKIKTELKKVFGIEYFTLAWNSKQDIKQIEKDLYFLLKDRKFKKFRITARRTEKTFSLNSQEIDKRLGAMVVKKMKKKVDLENFDLNIRLDLVRDFAFIYFDKIECRGGLPVGSAGNLLCLLSGGIDSPVAANLMQNRGAKIIYVNFDSYPATPKDNQEKVKELVGVLNGYQFESKLYIVPFLEIQKEILKRVPEDYRVIFYRRMMLRIARNICLQENILALITGESLGQVASQTIENITAIAESVDLPILRPCIGLNKEKIISLAKLAGTYDLSIQPFKDCCSLYVPKHPTTHADLNLILATEKDWLFQEILDQAMKNTEILNF